MQSSATVAQRTKMPPGHNADPVEAKGEVKAHPPPPPLSPSSQQTDPPSCWDPYPPSAAHVQYLVSKVRVSSVSLLDGTHHDKTARW